MYNINKNGLQNCTTDAPNSFNMGEAVSFTVTPNNGYEFDESKSKPYVMWSDGAGGYQTQNLIVADGVATLKPKMFAYSISIVAVCYPEPEKTNIEVNSMQNCTINQSTGLIVGDTVELILTPDNGFEFIDEQFHNNYLTPNIIVSDGAGGYVGYKFTLVDGVAMLIWKVVKGAILTNAVCYPSKRIVKYGAINIYSLDNDDLNDFANVRFMDVSGDDVDLGVYVNKLFRLFVNVETDGTDYIRCGKYNTNIEVDVPDTDVLILDFGNVSIPDYNKNITDYNSNIQIFLPFYGMLDITNDYVGEQISLEYAVNVVLGRGVIKIAFDGVPFQYFEVDLRSDLIYKTVTQVGDSYIGSEAWGVADMYGLEPYVIYKWYDGKQTGVGATYRNVKIGDLSGYNSFDDVEPITTGDMLVDEQRMIYSKLLEGVYV